VDADSLARAAALLRERNAIDTELAKLTGRPMTSGHLGEWIAAQIFDIALEEAANAPAIDGRFRSGPLIGQTVNVKWYLKQEGLLDMTESAALDFYLVLTGPRAAAVSTRSSTRPWHVDAVYLFHAADLLEQEHARNIKVGVATSVLTSQWENAEIFPVPRNPLLPLSPAQASLLRLFASPGEPDAGGEDPEPGEARD
jgi:hypothetical protein